MWTEHQNDKIENEPNKNNKIENETNKNNKIENEPNKNNKIENEPNKNDKIENETNKNDKIENGTNKNARKRHRVHVVRLFLWNRFLPSCILIICYYRQVNILSCKMWLKNNIWKYQRRSLKTLVVIYFI